MPTVSDRADSAAPAQWSRDQGSPVLIAVCVTAITLLAAVVRLRGLDAQGITLDEALSIFLARAPFPDFAHTIWRSELNMAPYYLLLRGWMHLGHCEWIVRLLGVVLSTATVPIVYGLGRRLFNARAGLIAAALLALHPFDAMLARNARAYPLVILLVCLSGLSFIRGLQKPTWLTWTVYAVLSAAAVYSHFFAVLVVVAQLASLLFVRLARVPWKQLLYALALLAVLLFPWAVFMATNGEASHIAWVQPLSAQQLRWLLYSLTLGKARSLTYVFLWIVAAWSAVRAANDAERWPYWFVFLWLSVPVALAIAASLRQPLLVERFLSICLPASVLLAAAGIARLATFSRLIAVAVFALLVFYSLSAIRFNERHIEVDEGWRQSSRRILQNLQPGDVVIAEGMKGLAFDYYRDTYTGSLPSFQRLDSFTRPLPSPLPANIWVLGWVRANPGAPGAAPRNDTQAVQLFSEEHRDEYCGSAPVFDAGVTRVWRFARCSLGDAGPPTVQ